MVTGWLISVIPIVIIVVSFFKQPISAEQYRWLSRQVETHPEMRNRISENHADDGLDRIAYIHTNVFALPLQFSITKEFGDCAKGHFQRAISD